MDNSIVINSSTIKSIDEIIGKKVLLWVGTSPDASIGFYDKIKGEFAETAAIPLIIRGRYHKVKDIEDIGKCHVIKYADVINNSMYDVINNSMYHEILKKSEIFSGRTIDPEKVKNCLEALKHGCSEESSQMAREMRIKEFYRSVAVPVSLDPKIESATADFISYLLI